MKSDRRRIRIAVTGRVQGVGYRYATVQRAQALEIVGWVRNCRDGSVEVAAVGEGPALASLIEWCEHGPGAARVDTVRVASDSGDEEWQDFEVRR